MAGTEKAKKKRPFVWVESAEVIRAMRRGFRRYPPYQEVVRRCRVEWYQDCKNGNKRLRISQRCEVCQAVVLKKQWAVDHIDPIVDPKVGYVDHNTYAKRLYCAIANLQGICKYCHKTKCNAENATRRKTRIERKTNGKQS